MVNRKAAQKIRKAHRYLGLFLGIQFLFWTVSGLYFSWTDIDEIHGDHFRNLSYQPPKYNELISPSDLKIEGGIRSVSIKSIQNTPYYWVNKQHLYNAKTGESKNSITKEEALSIAKNYMKSDLKVASIEKITSVDKHHEYREKLLPAFVISYDNPEKLKAYISVKNGQFQTVRHRNWRWFDFLWMTHTMDYEGRDDINNTVLRIFSLLGLITVLSGFLLWYTSSPSIRKIKKRNK